MIKNLYRFIFNFRNQYERFQSRDWLPTQKIKAELVEKELLDNIYKRAEQDSLDQIVKSMILKWILFYDKEFSISLLCNVCSILL